MSQLRIALLILSLGLAMILSTVLGVRHRTGIVVLALLSLVWLLVDQDFEGTVLITVNGRHGLTESDLVGLAGFAVAGGLWLRTRTRHKRQAGNNPTDSAFNTGPTELHQ